MARAAIPAPFALMLAGWVLVSRSAQTASPFSVVVTAIGGMIVRYGRVFAAPVLGDEHAQAVLDPRLRAQALT